MNPQLATMLAARLGLTAEQMTALQAGDPGPLVASGALDAETAMLMGAMRQRPPAAEDAAPTPEQMVARARAILRRMKDDLDAADTLNAYVAGVFGACRACWGLNPACAACAGRGAPGWQPPQREALVGWTVPALRRIGLRVSRAHPPRPLEPVS